MGKIEKSITIEKSPVDVWKTLTDISGYRSWNPVVNHAAIYGPVDPGTEIKAMLGKWDFKFIIITARAIKELEIQGGSIGLKVNLRFIINGGGDVSKVLLSATVKGWLAGLLANKVNSAAEDTLEIFLNSLKKRVMSAGSYEIEREDSGRNESENNDKSMPTPFNLIYKTRTRKFRGGGSKFR